MKKLFKKTFPQPIKPEILVRVLVAIIVILTYIAGYYHSLWQVELKKLDSLKDCQYNAEQLKE